MLAGWTAVAAGQTRNRYEMAVDGQGRLLFGSGLVLRTEPAGSTVTGVCLVQAGAVTLVRPYAGNPRLSIDGRVLAYTKVELVADPASGSEAVARAVGVIELSDRSGDRTVSRPGYQVEISPNGEWALFTNGDLRESSESLLLELETGAEFALPKMPAPFRLLSNDGSVAVATDSGFQIYRRGLAGAEVELGFRPWSLLMNPDGSSVLLDGQSGEGNHWGMFVWSDAGLQQLGSDAGHPHPVGWSADATQVFFVTDEDDDGRPVWITELAGGVARVVTVLPRGVVTQEVSRDGRWLWYSDFATGIFKVDLENGETSSVVPPTPTLESSPLFAVPGERVSLFGLGLQDARVEISGRPVNVVFQTPTLLSAIVPAELPLELTAWKLSSDLSPFQSNSYRLMPSPQAPKILTLMDLGETQKEWKGLPVLFSEENGDLINRNRPARPGEVLRLWMTGVGSDARVLRWTLWPELDGTSQQGYAVQVLSTERDAEREGWTMVRLILPADAPGTVGNLECLPPNYRQGKATSATVYYGRTR